MITGLDNKILFDPAPHTYKHRDTGLPYLSVSKFIEHFAEPFDKANISKAVAKNRGVSQAVVLQEWDATRDDAIDHGNRLHEALELFEKTTRILPENEDIRSIIISISSMYQDYYKKYLEQILRSDRYGVCGTTDKLLKCTSHKDSFFDLDDYKTNKTKGIVYFSKYRKFLKGPLSHLQDCNYNRYAIQLSIYAYMFEEMTGKRVRMLNILFIPSTNLMAYRRIPVPYMKAEVQNMFDWYDKNILNPPVIRLGMNLTSDN